MQAAMLVLLLRRHCIIWGESIVKELPPFFTNDKLKLHRDINSGVNVLLDGVGRKIN